MEKVSVNFLNIEDGKPIPEGMVKELVNNNPLLMDVIDKVMESLDDCIPENISGIVIPELGLALDFIYGEPQQNAVTEHDNKKGKAELNKAAKGIGMFVDFVNLRTDKPLTDDEVEGLLANFQHVRSVLDKISERYESHPDLNFIRADFPNLAVSIRTHRDISAHNEQCSVKGKVTTQDFPTEEKEVKETAKTKEDIVLKADKNKPRLDLVPLEGLVPMAKVREFALKKYGQDGIEAWREISDERLLAALLRHLLAYQMNPEAVDEESGLPAIYHVEANAMFLAIKAFERLANAENQANPNMANVLF